ncbi:MAG: hypothetical protein Q9178_007714 [Gyalolechia marmorata]
MRQPIPLLHTSLISSKAFIPSIAMPAATRGSQGITAPRLPFVPTTAPEQSRSSTTTTTKKKNSSTTAAATKKLKSAAAAAAAKASTTTTGTEANTSKPRAGKTAAAAGVAGDKTTSGRVTKKAAAGAPKGKKTATTTTTAKKGAPKTVNKREPSLLDKVVGVKDKIVGTLEGKPGKKAAGTKKIRGTDGKGATRAKK